MPIHKNDLKQKQIRIHCGAIPSVGQMSKMKPAHHFLERFDLPKLHMLVLFICVRLSRSTVKEPNFIL
jgi:hypothetical protein